MAQSAPDRSGLGPLRSSARRERVVGHGHVHHQEPEVGPVTERVEAHRQCGRVHYDSSGRQPCEVAPSPSRPRPPPRRSTRPSPVVQPGQPARRASRLYKKTPSSPRRLLVAPFQRPPEIRRGACELAQRAAGQPAVMVVLGQAELVNPILWVLLDQGLAGCDGPLGVVAGLGGAAQARSTKENPPSALAASKR